MGLYHTYTRSSIVLTAYSHRVIGTSFNNWPITTYTYGTGSIRVLIVAAIHGNEVGTVSVSERLVQWLHSNDENADRFTVHIIPVLNPDGYVIAQKHPDYWHDGAQGRFNARGVDLNRNFPTSDFSSESHWGRGKGYTETTDVYCGESGGSEPEIQALINHIDTFNPTVYISLHNAAAAVMGGTTPLSQELADAFSKGSGYYRESLDEWDALGQTGTAKQWCDERGLAYVEIEGRYRWAADWKAHREGMREILHTLNELHR